MRKHIKTIILVVVAFVVGYFIGDSTAINRVNENWDQIVAEKELAKALKGEDVEVSNNNKGEATKEKEWVKVIVFEGESIKDTETFKISSNEWRIAWETEPGDMGEMNFQIYVYDEDGNPVSIAANVIGKGEDTSYMRGSGRYYLTINTAQPYKITIEENK